jgi:NAD(P)-dependent dehydrogenase (short-subunit alcohol dehydrogenase family)
LREGVLSSSGMSNSSYRPVALITGANKGIGLEIARQLGKDHGMTVLVGARDQERGNAAAEKLKGLGIDARAIRLDVTDRASVEAVAQQIERDFGGRLDVLVNNAGIALDRNPPSQTDLEKFKTTHETNVFGPLLVTTTMLPLLKRSAAGRVVNMSSGLGSLAQNNDPAWEFAQVKLVAYNSSKAALNMQTVLFARELAGEGSAIKVNSADPGYTATDLNHHQGHRTVEEGARAAVRLATLPPNGPTGGFFNEDGPVPW